MSWCRSISVGMFVALYGSVAFAQASPIPKFETLLGVCSAAVDKQYCDAMQKSLKEDWLKALKRDYQGQRNVAFCLTTGCDHAFAVDKIEGCAWRMIIQGSNVRKDAGD